MSDLYSVLVSPHFYQHGSGQCVVITYRTGRYQALYNQIRYPYCTVQARLAWRYTTHHSCISHAQSSNCIVGFLSFTARVTQNDISTWFSLIYLNISLSHIYTCTFLPLWHLPTPDSPRMYICTSFNVMFIDLQYT